MQRRLLTQNTAKRARHAETGYIGLPDPKKEQVRRIHGLEELTGEDYGFEVRPWDGKTPFPIVDRAGTIIGVAIGHPEDDEWDQLHQHAAECLEQARQCPKAELSEDNMRRGGLDMSMRCLAWGRADTPQELLEHQSDGGFARIPQLTALLPTSGIVYFVWAPALHKHYCEELSKLQAHDPSLRRAFEASVFMAMTYNLGPQTVCFRHLDSGNLAYGWCVITSLEFPPGSTILIPSALIHHSNTPINKGETRYSFTQCASGGLFRWVDHRFTTVEAHRASLSKQELAELDKRNAARWAMGLVKLPRMPWVPGPDV
ncbi:hypothetical protein NLJ89_g8661 [Agrocybe chaxingu]|uniref:Uncharacterized protein n=1 Tax=Agrocybe chaxingu TaxID=84603 RepID=A0A9W8JUX2_9AGAR|nr:hypothetical protein NLJ89_g8661 [Agrocybe chaxingu]